MAGLPKSSAIGTALSGFVTAMEALPFARGDGQAPSGQRVVRTIVDALSGMVDNGDDGLDQRAPGVVSHSALVSFLDTIALDVINHVGACPPDLPGEPSPQAREAARPVVPPLPVSGDRNVRAVVKEDARRQTAGTVAEFVGALRSLSPHTMVSAGSGGIAFARVAFALGDVLPVRPTEADGDVVCTEDAVAAVSPLAETSAALPGDPCSFNVVRLLGGAVAAHRLADALTTCALERPDVLVLVGDRVVATPLSAPCIDLTSSARPMRDSALNPFSVPDNRAALVDAWRAVQSGASSDHVANALARSVTSSAAAPISLYRVEGVLYSDRGLADAYPSMGSDVRDVLFCRVAASDNNRGAFVLYETLIAKSVLAAAYGPNDARIGAAHRLANDARAHQRRSKIDPRPPGIVRRDVEYDTVSQTVDTHGVAFVVYTLTGCPYSERLSAILDDVAAETPGVPVLTVEREKIPTPHRPFAYPHLFVAKPDGHVVFCSTTRTKAAIVDFVKSAAAGPPRVGTHRA
ncbi:Thioredoxin-like domain containing protein [Pandoravirus neocaledonia]|uniref:Thioredoxin-like domain containing protein n=1 Tax=Pandoravirus neocaledonia TaxID=2107708 RepID=A0A2U7UCU3_9VIRU|nr:Thioredoxin-like domain containing protein [Pandoravirus neocaledonia]AVK76175.1 Thioredoxin-like domain containing protein [Pandoravirus neocaledonia]